MKTSATTILSLLITNKTDEAILLLKQEIASAVSGNINTYKARLAFSKYTAKTFAARPSFAGAYKLNDKQIICNGYAIGIYNDILEGMVEAKETESPFDYTKILPNGVINKTLPLDIVKLKTQIKIAKAERAQPLIKVAADVLFDAKIVLMLLSTFEKPIVYLDNKRLCIKGGNGEGIICNFNINGVDEKRALNIYDINENRENAVN